MTIPEALAMLDQAISQINTNRQTHIALQQALAVVAEAANKAPKEPEKPKETE